MTLLLRLVAAPTITALTHDGWRQRWEKKTVALGFAGELFYAGFYSRERRAQPFI
jgi:hypothetical protein